MPFVLIVVVLFIVIAELHIKSRKRHKILTRFYPNANLDREETKELSYSLLKLLKQKSKFRLGRVERQDTVTEMVGILKNHIRFCRLDQCECKKLRFDSEELQAQVEDEEQVAVDKKLEDNAPSKSLEQIVCEMLNLTLHNLGQRGDSGENEIIQAYINYFMISRLFHALYNIMLAEEYNLTLFDEFKLFSLRYVLAVQDRKTIEVKMLEEGRRNTSSMGASFCNVVTFHKKYMALHDLISSTTLLYCTYWSEYLKARPGNVSPHCRTSRARQSRLQDLQELRKDRAAPRTAHQLLLQLHQRPHTLCAVSEEGGGG